jgi:hypothetical protein
LLGVRVFDSVALLSGALGSSVAIGRKTSARPSTFCAKFSGCALGAHGHLRSLSAAERIEPRPARKRIPATTMPASHFNGLKDRFTMSLLENSLFGQMGAA